MARRLAKTSVRPRRPSPTPTSPINFRMPRPLRERLTKFASARHLGEAEALRVVVSEHLEEVETAAEMSAAERWQYEQAYTTWDRFLAGQGRTVPREHVRGIIDRALAEAETAERKA